MSIPVIRAWPSRSLIRSASSYAARMPSAMSGRGQPWEPTCACSRLSQGWRSNASVTASTAPGSRSATPNFEVAVAVLIAPMAPAPTCGFTRIPMGPAASQ